MDFTRPIEALIPGARGRILAVLAETTAELNQRTIAQLADISPAQASRVLPELVTLGLVERREVPPSSLFRLVREHVASRALLQVARSTDLVLEEIGRSASALPHPPTSVIVFGSFARREADDRSDIDILVIRPTDLDEDDETWSDSLQNWSDHVRRLRSNQVEVLEIGHGEVTQNHIPRDQLWHDLYCDGQVVHGLPLEELD